MRFVELNGFAVRQDRQVEFQEWVAANRDAIAASYPEGVRFEGIFATVFTSEKGAGEYFWMDSYESYAALDLLAARSKDPGSELHRLLTEFLRFSDPDRGAGWSRILVKSVVDATVMDLPAD